VDDDHTLPIGFAFDPHTVDALQRHRRAARIPGPDQRPRVTAAAEVAAGRPHRGEKGLSVPDRLGRLAQCSTLCSTQNRVFAALASLQILAIPSGIAAVCV